MQLLIKKLYISLVRFARSHEYVAFWARLVVRTRKPFIIGVTGSAGKTTTITMIASVLMHPAARVGLVGCTNHLEDMNNDLGIGLTLLRYDSYSARRYLIPFRALWLATKFTSYPKIMVLEYGACAPGDLKLQVRSAPPNIAVVTTIGPAHLEFLRSVEGVILEKGELVRAVPSNGLVILGAEHEHVFQLEAMSRAPVIRAAGRGAELSRNIVRIICQHLGISQVTVSSSLEEFVRPEGRLKRIDCLNVTLIDDSYNANPLSMKLGLDYLVQIAGTNHRRVAILGAMAELGEEAPFYHEQIGTRARELVDVLIGVGELARHYKPDTAFSSSESCASQIVKFLKPGDCVLVKGSHSVNMALIVEAIRKID